MQGPKAQGLMQMLAERPMLWLMIISSRIAVL